MEVITSKAIKTKLSQLKLFRMKISKRLNSSLKMKPDAGRLKLRVDEKLGKFIFTYDVDLRWGLESNSAVEKNGLRILVEC